MPTFEKIVIPEFGDADVLERVTAEIAAPKNGEVQIEGLFASVNPIDVKTRAGLGWAAQSNKDNLPWTPGYDLVGRVVDVGEKDSPFAIGDYVTGFMGFPLRGGAYAQKANVPTEELVSVPSSITFEAAAAIPLAGLTALQAVAKANVNSGDSVLILGGAGGVGHVAVQLAVETGAQVFTTCGESNLDYMATLGATALNYHAAPVSQQLQQVDAIIDLVGGHAAIDAIACLKPQGRVVTIPTITADAVKQAAQAQGATAEGMLVEPNIEQLSALLGKIGSGLLKVEIEKIYPLDQVSDAHRHVESGHTRGKVLINLSATG